MILIILRGPAGSGKSEVCERLKNKIKEQKSIESCFLNLDETCSKKFEINMEEVLECEYVIGEMFSGSGHTTNPKIWLNRFMHYMIFSFILRASIKTCLQRCSNDKKSQRSQVYLDEEQHKRDHYKFYNCPEYVNFAKNAGIYEKTINTETKSIEEVVNIIFSKIKSSLG